MIESYKRWRHSRGYGVHSPFAYRIVKQALFPKRGYAWYGYALIEGNENEYITISERRRARMLLRLAAFLDIGSAYIQTDVNGPYYRALKGSCSKLLIYDNLNRLDDCSMVCVNGGEVSIDRLKSYIAIPGRTLLIENVKPEDREILYDAMDEGVMLYGKRNAILISRIAMQKVRYSVRI